MLKSIPQLQSTMQLFTIESKSPVDAIFQVGQDNSLEIGANTLIGMNCIINGTVAKIKIGNNVSISQNVNILTDSGPNASLKCGSLPAYQRSCYYREPLLDRYKYNYHAQCRFGRFLYCSSE